MERADGGFNASTALLLPGAEPAGSLTDESRGPLPTHQVGTTSPRLAGDEVGGGGGGVSVGGVGAGGPFIEARRRRANGAASVPRGARRTRRGLGTGRRDTLVAQGRPRLAGSHAAESRLDSKARALRETGSAGARWYGAR